MIETDASSKVELYEAYWWPGGWKCQGKGETHLLVPFLILTDSSADLGRRIDKLPSGHFQPGSGL